MDASLSMTRAVSFRLLFSVIPEHFFCHSEPERGIRSWMLRCAQHDKSGKRGCCTWHDKVGMAKLTLWSLSLQKERGWQPHPVALRRPSPCKRRGMFWRKPKQGEVARSSKHFFVISEHFLLSFQVLFFVIPSEARNPQTILCSNLPNQD